jgi:hypothetical protein
MKRLQKYLYVWIIIIIQICTLHGQTLLALHYFATGKIHGSLLKFCTSNWKVAKFYAKFKIFTSAKLKGVGKCGAMAQHT